ncbi:hypothetical protein [Actinopolyspora halophila]|uniref:hypothetical protein n=1 Tax=Actinopolyspora halophila TaxID=1850 RepID=UPI0003810342|nr:hypothetical protein [Actinopolyspora halophila]
MTSTVIDPRVSRSDNGGPGNALSPRKDAGAFYTRELRDAIAARNVRTSAHVPDAEECDSCAAPGDVAVYWTAAEHPHHDEMAAGCAICAARVIDRALDESQPGTAVTVEAAPEVLR